MQKKNGKLIRKPIFYIPVKDMVNHIKTIMLTKRNKTLCIQLEYNKINTHFLTSGHNNRISRNLSFNLSSSWFLLSFL